MPDGVSSRNEQSLGRTSLLLRCSDGDTRVET